jgi:hypothetical protein
MLCAAFDLCGTRIPIHFQLLLHLLGLILTQRLLVLTSTRRLPECLRDITEVMNIFRTRRNLASQAHPKRRALATQQGSPHVRLAATSRRLKGLQHIHTITASVMIHISKTMTNPIRQIRPGRNLLSVEVHRQLTLKEPLAVLKDQILSILIQATMLQVVVRRLL